MEVMFISVLDLSLEARIKFCSDSIVDLLGYYPSEVKGNSCWEYFHPDEIDLAKSIHNEGIHLNKAADLNYFHVRHKNGDWISCECVFTVAYDVLISITSVYNGGPKSTRRALDGANVTRIFSSYFSPSRARPYDLLSVLSNKFYQQPQGPWWEPRAALFLNRFTRSSTIMFATRSVSNILGGVRAEQLVGKSFYYCIAENCLADAVKRIETAKSNDSIVYLRFWYRDPTLPEQPQQLPIQISDDDDFGMEEDDPPSLSHTTDSLPRGTNCATRDAVNSNPPLLSNVTTTERCWASKSSDSHSSENGKDKAAPLSSFSSFSSSSSSSSFYSSTTATMSDEHKSSLKKSRCIEIEAVVLCSSDTLVVVIRRAHPKIPQTISDIKGDNDKVALREER